MVLGLRERRARYQLALISPLLLSWLIIATAPWLATLIAWRSDYEPRLPNVGVIPWNPTGDFMSSVPGLFKVLLFAGFGALAVEVSKALLRNPAWPSYVLLVVYQTVLVADTLRAYAYDWWVYLAFWLGLRSTGLGLGFHTGRPWASFLAMIAMSWYLWRQPRGEPPAVAAPSEKALA
jgi:hypothetical protein